MQFMIFVDRFANIKKVLSCEPAGIIKEGKSLLDLIVRESHELILSLHQGGTGENLCCYTTTQLIIDGKAIPITLHSCHTRSDMLFIGVSDDSLCRDMANMFTSTFNEFVNSMREQFKIDVQLREESVQYRFEEIQKLNSEIINIRRKLEKANIEKDMANKELQGRLIKDALTGLIGRYQYWGEIDLVIKRDPGKYGVCSFIDIDNFKSINDIYGHAAGDAYLIEFARRLNEIDIPNTLKIRIAGDEFALFSYGYEYIDNEVFEKIWDSISDKVMSKPIVINGNKLIVSLSVGMAVYGQDTGIITELIEYADFAMYKVKKSGKNYYCRFSKDDYMRAKGLQE